MTALQARCSFCMKSENEVLCLVSGPGVAICNECVQLCVSTIRAKAATESEVP